MTFTPIVIGTGLAGYAYLRDTQTAQRETLTNTAQNRREAEQFREAMGSIQTSEDLLDDRLLLRVALGAFGLDEDINNRAFLQQVLDSDLDDPTSLANRLSDKRYFGLAQAFGFNTAAGPQVPGTQEASELAQRLEGVNSAQDLLADTELLVATLRSFDLPAQDADNLYFLENVLTSDPDDPTSFANTLSDTRYGDLARDLDFVARAQTGSLVGLANAAAAADPPIQTADDLLANRDVLDRALDLYGLGSTIAPDTFLLDVLNSDLEDPSSFANTQSDDLWTSFASTFGFGERLARPGSFRAENTRFDGMVEAWAGAPESFEESSEVLRDTSLSLSAVQFFDLKLGDTGFDRIRLVLDSDRDSATSLANVLSDDRYRLLADSIEIAPPSTEWSPPKGLADAIMESYLERQFEIRVGEVDTDMRLALGFEREMGDLLNNAQTNNARWFGVMASEPLRQVFEAALDLPDSFGTLDLDRQLGEFKARAEQRLGTSDLEELTSPENIDIIRQRFLGAVTIAGGQQNFPTSGASAILTTIQTSLGQF